MGLHDVLRLARREITLFRRNDMLYAEYEEESVPDLSRRDPRVLWLSASFIRQLGNLLVVALLVGKTERWSDYGALQPRGVDDRRSGWYAPMRI